MIENYYHILGLENFSAPQEIKQAYRQLAKKYHPDINPTNEDHFKRINHAYQILNNTAKKEKFDNLLRLTLHTTYTTKERFENIHPKYTSYEYSRRTWIYGVIFILALVLLTLALPVALIFKASNYSYHQGIKEYENGNLPEALSQFDNAITYWGERSGEASIKGARVGLDEFNNPSRGLYFIEKGLRYTSNEIYLGELRYLKGKAIKMKGDYVKSKNEFLLSDSLGYSKDSIQLQLGILNAFYLEEYASALQNFEFLIDSNPKNYQALFGKGWCEQKLNNHHSAIEIFQSLIDIKKADPATFYYIGISKMAIGDTISACLDIKQALSKGYKPAEKEVIKNCTSLN